MGDPFTVTLVAALNALPSVGATLKKAMIGMPTPRTSPSPLSSDTWTGLPNGVGGAAGLEVDAAEVAAADWEPDAEPAFEPVVNPAEPEPADVRAGELLVQ